MKRTDELRIIIRPPPSLLFPRLDSFSSREILFSLETSNDSTFSYCQLDFVTNSTLGVATVREHDLRSTGRWSRRELKIMEKLWNYKTSFLQIIPNNFDSADSTISALSNFTRIPWNRYITVETISPGKRRKSSLVSSRGTLEGLASRSNSIRWNANDDKVRRMETERERERRERENRKTGRIKRRKVESNEYRERLRRRFASDKYARNPFSRDAKHPSSVGGVQRNLCNLPYVSHEYASARLMRFDSRLA